MEEKRWIVYQLLKALEEMRRHRTTHGDLKAENVLLTSWNWIVLTDLAPFKPTRLPEENPAVQFSPASGPTRQACLVAPERFSNRREDDTPTTRVSWVISWAVKSIRTRWPERNSSSSSHLSIPRKDTVSDDPREDSNLSTRWIFSVAVVWLRKCSRRSSVYAATLDYASGFDLKTVLKKTFVDDDDDACDFLDEMREMVEHMLCWTPRRVMMLHVRGVFEVICMFDLCSILRRISTNALKHRYRDAPFSQAIIHISTHCLQRYLRIAREESVLVVLWVLFQARTREFFTNPSNTMPVSLIRTLKIYEYCL